MQLEQISAHQTQNRAWFKNYKFHLIKHVSEVKKLVDICLEKTICSLDLETTGVDNRVYPDDYFEDDVKTRHGMRTISKIVGICISPDGLNGYYIPLSHLPEDSGNLPWDPVFNEIERLVYNCRIIMHNAKFDAEFLYPVTGKDLYKTSEYEDTYLMAKVFSPLKSSPAGLKQLAKSYFEVDMIELLELFTPEMKSYLEKNKLSTHNFAVLHPKEGVEYGCSDAIFTYKLYFSLRDKLNEQDLHIYALEKSFCNVIRELERNRVHIDVNELSKLLESAKVTMTQTADVIRSIIEDHSGKTGRWLTLNVGSPKQLSQALITDGEGLRIPPIPEMTGENNEFEDALSGGDNDDASDDSSVDSDKQYTLKDEILKALNSKYGSLYKEKPKDGAKAHSLFDLILEWRHYSKLIGSYLEPLSQAVDKNGDVRPNFSQMGTDTARLSSRAGTIKDGYSGINFQGIPRDSDDDKPELFKAIRSIITPRNGYVLVKLDFAGEELRVVTNLSGDPIWTKSFLYEDGDVHSITARTLFGKNDVSKDERNRGKRCNFAFIYGGGSGAIQRNIGCTKDEASQHMDNLKRDVPVLMGYVEHQKHFARKNKCIYTAFGRRIPIPTIDSPIRAIRSKAERCAINYTIQSTSADVLKFAMCYVDKQLRMNNLKEDCRYVLTVHDEVVYEVKPHKLQEVVRLLDEWMTYPWKLPKAHGRKWIVPLLTEPGIDINWKARFDYFKMVDGVPADKKYILEDGSYTGKLKKDEYFHDGRVYQKIPDFLESYLKRQDQRGSPVKNENDFTPSTDSNVEEVNSATDSQLQERDEPPPSEPEVPPEDSLEIQSYTVGNQLALEKADSSTVKPDTTGAKPTIVEYKPTPKSMDVYRHVFRAAMNELNLRKLHAISILAEGSIPLRLISNNGNIMVSEDQGIKVNPEEFTVLCRMFGLS